MNLHFYVLDLLPSAPLSSFLLLSLFSPSLFSPPPLLLSSLRSLSLSLAVSQPVPPVIIMSHEHRAARTEQSFFELLQPLFDVHMVWKRRRTEVMERVEWQEKWIGRVRKREERRVIQFLLAPVQLPLSLVLCYWQIPYEEMHPHFRDRSIDIFAITRKQQAPS